MNKISGISNASDVWGSILGCVDDAINERIALIEGDTVHTDWDENYWQNYKEENCQIRNMEDFIECSERAAKFELHRANEEEYAEVAGMAFTILQKRLGF